MGRIGILALLSLMWLAAHTTVASASSLKMAGAAGKLPGAIHVGGPYNGSGRGLFDTISDDLNAEVYAEYSNVVPPNLSVLDGAAAVLNSEAKTSLDTQYIQFAGVPSLPGLTIDPGSICIGGICISWPPISVTKNVPEPGALLLLALGTVAAIVAYRRRKLPAAAL